VALGLAEAGGGHIAAAGLTVADNKFEAWKEWILNQSSHELALEPSVEVDGFIPELGLNRLANLESFAPFGPGNPIPKLILKAAWLKDVIFSGEHARCILQSGRCIFAFRVANSWGIELKRRIGKHVDLLLSVDENSVKIEDAMDSQ
jgi:single-stranded DNA-specific DHH superfamily exonuclease